MDSHFEVHLANAVLKTHFQHWSASASTELGKFKGKHYSLSNVSLPAGFILEVKRSVNDSENPIDDLWESVCVLEYFQDEYVVETILHPYEHAKFRYT